MGEKRILCHHINGIGPVWKQQILIRDEFIVFLYLLCDTQEKKNVSKLLNKELVIVLKLLHLGAVNVIA